MPRRFRSLPAVFAFLHDLPAVVVGFLIILASIGYSVAGIAVIGRVEPPETRHTYNDIVGFVIAVVGVVYAVLLAWAAIAAWETHDRAEMAVEREASLVADVAELAEGLGETGVAIRAQAAAYVEVVLSTEWAAMTSGERPTEGWAAAEAMRTLVLAHRPADDGETLAQDHLLEQVTAFIDARRDRLYLADYGIHPVIWSVIVLGTLLIVALSFFFGLERRRHQVLTSILAVSVALVVFMIVELDRPFMGDMAVDPEMFRMTAERLAAGAPA